ncbi:MAG: tetraacyldisaccharide 4'-kinase [Sedimentisphaerales bacterium]
MQLKQEIYRKLISGQSGSLGLVLLRFLLQVAAIGYSTTVRLRNFLYSKGWLTAHRANAIVISVGNITVGGTGKTPLVIWLCNLLRQKNTLCAILTRGYKTRRASCVMRRAKNTRDTQYDIRDTIDEPAILAKSCPETQVIVNPDRVAGAAEAVQKFGAEVLIMDDGFQHRRLARDLDIVTIDATQPFGYGRILPAGLLREPLSALKRADAVVITRCDQTKEDKLTELEQKLQQINGNMIMARSIHAPICAKSTENKEINLEKLRNKKIFAFCGIGNPDSFSNTIQQLGSELVGSKIYNDHHHYTQACLADICEQAERLKANLILTTHKDWTSTQHAIRNTQYEIPFAYLKIELKFTSGENELTALIENAITDKICAK